MISLAITSYNRFDLTIDSFRQVLNDDRVKEIIIVDDHSDMEIYDKLQEFCKSIPKILLVRNPFNLGMGLNKRKAISICSSDHVCIFDSDNELKIDYFDAFFTNGQMMTDKVISIPDFAYPNFNFTAYSGKFIDYTNAKQFMGDPMFRCALNCCNYVVPKDTYLDVYEHDKSVGEADTIAFNYLWLKRGYSFYVVPGMRYFHRVHDGSGFLSNVKYNMEKAAEFENKIKAL